MHKNHTTGNKNQSKMKIEVREKVINIKTTKMAKKIIEGTVHINHTTGNKCENGVREKVIDIKTTKMVQQNQTEPHNIWKKLKHISKKPHL